MEGLSDSKQRDQPAPATNSPEHFDMGVGEHQDFSAGEPKRTEITRPFAPPKDLAIESERAPRSLFLPAPLHQACYLTRCLPEKIVCGTVRDPSSDHDDPRSSEGVGLP